MTRRDPQDIPEDPIESVTFMLGQNGLLDPWGERIRPFTQRWAGSGGSFAFVDLSYGIGSPHAVVPFGGRGFSPEAMAAYEQELLDHFGWPTQNEASNAARRALQSGAGESVVLEYEGIGHWCGFVTGVEDDDELEEILAAVGKAAREEAPRQEHFTLLGAVGVAGDLEEARVRLRRLLDASHETTRHEGDVVLIAPMINHAEPHSGLHRSDALLGRSFAQGAAADGLIVASCSIGDPRAAAESRLAKADRSLLRETVETLLWELGKLAERIGGEGSRGFLLEDDQVLILTSSASLAEVEERIEAERRRIAGLGVISVGPGQHLWEVTLTSPLLLEAGAVTVPAAMSLPEAIEAAQRARIC